MTIGGGGSQLQLDRVIDLRAAQRIQDTFAHATGFAALMVGKTGIPLTRGSNFRPICLLIRSTERGRARCEGCDAAGGSAAFDSGKAQTYVCNNGLIDVAAPISIDGVHLGGIHCGQVLPAESYEEQIEEILRRNDYLGLPREQLLALARSVPVLPRERIAAAAELLHLLAGQIVQQGVDRLERADAERGPQGQIYQQQSLLNAHFLFNSLTLVSASAMEESAPRTEEIAYCLSEMLRYSLRHMARSVAFEHELAMVRHYLRLQQFRLGARLQAEISVDPALLELPIPCMILQPLVENAIVHGAEPLGRPVTVQVRAYQWLDGLMIQVCDDGAGVDPAVAAAINGRGEGERVGGLGLGTVIRRLEAEYGPRCAVRIEGGPGYGTQVMVYLPVRAG